MCVVCVNVKRICAGVRSVRLCVGDEAPLVVIGRGERDRSGCWFKLLLPVFCSKEGKGRSRPDDWLIFYLSIHSCA